MADRSYSVYNGNDSWCCKNQRFFSKSEFEINFVAGDSNYETILDLLDDNHRQLGIKRKWIRLLVKNTGRADAHTCYVELNVPETSFNTGKLHPSEMQRLCWKDESTNFITLGRKVDKRYIEVVFADSNFDGDIYAMTSTKDLVKSIGFTPSQRGFGLGDFEIDVTVCGNGVIKTVRMELHVDKDYAKTTLRHIRKDGPKKDWNIISNIYNRLKRPRVLNPAPNH